MIGRLSRQRLPGIVLLALAVWFLVTFYGAAHLYADWQPVIGPPLDPTLVVPNEELSFDLWYVVYGGGFIACLAGALHLLSVTPRLSRPLRRLYHERNLAPFLMVLIVAISVVVRQFVLRREVVADDENVYQFIAQTLLRGRVINPLPDDPEFFQNQYTVINSRGWFGMYPIGHGIVLAIGFALHAIELIIPVMGGLTAWMTWNIGRRVFGPRRALVGLALLALSPHFTFTYATLLSQTTMCFAGVAGTAALLRAERIRSSAWLCVAGVAFGFGLLTRPMPGGLFAVVGAVHLALLHRKELAKAIRPLALFGFPVVLAVGAVMGVNFIESGNPMRSGYHEVFNGLGIMGDFQGQIGQSVLAAIVRENFWLLGWPLSLVPVLFARPRRARVLMYGPIIAELFYRITVPKTVVSATGPVYVMEAVPFLALLASDGLARLAGLWSRRTRAFSGATVLMLTLVCTLTTVAFFVPIQTIWLRNGANDRLRLQAAIDQTGLPRGVIFMTLQLPPVRRTWALYTRSNKPDYTDDWLLLRWPRPEVGDEKYAYRYWKSHWPDRPAFIFKASDDKPLHPLFAPLAQ